MFEVGDRVYAGGLGSKHIGTVTDRSREESFSGNVYWSYAVEWDDHDALPEMWRRPTLWFPGPMLCEVDPVTRLSDLA